jgi:hypothetical protein
LKTIHKIKPGVFVKFLSFGLLVCLFSVTFSVSAVSQTSGGQQAPQDKKLQQTITPDLQAKVWTGDLDGMLKRRNIRARVVYSKTQYYVAKGVQLGMSYEGLKAFETYINTKYPPKTRNLKFHVIFIPTPRAQLLSRLAKKTTVVSGPNGTVAASKTTVVGAGGTASKTTVVATGNTASRTTVVVGGSSLPHGYVAVMPVGYRSVTVSGVRYYTVGGIYYRPQMYQGHIVYVAVRL